MREVAALPGAVSPWMNVAGFLGNFPQPGQPFTTQPGAFVTHPISLLPRSPAHNRCMIEFPGGFLLHTGYPNGGLNQVVKKFHQKWSKLNSPVWLHLIPSTPYECQQMIRAIEEVENVGAVEIEIPLEGSRQFLSEMLQAASGELPYYLCIPANKISLDLIDLYRLYGVSGIVLTALRGTLVHNNRIVHGRLFGPNLLAQTFQALCQLKTSEIPLIAGSGIFTFEQAEEAIELGASAVQFDAALWQLNPLIDPSKS
jgi:dihydroorotate dehydrogenase